MNPARRFPPSVLLGTLALGAIVIGGIVMASSAPRRPDLPLPVALLVVSVLLFGTAMVLLTRVPGFAWGTFVRVYRWALLAYTVSAGMIEFAFVRNHTRGTPLVVVSAMLVVFATVVPFLIATTVARCAHPEPSA